MSRQQSFMFGGESGFFTKRLSYGGSEDHHNLQAPDIQAPGNDDMAGTTFEKVVRPPHTFYERIVYALDILIPEDEAEDMAVPAGHFLQRVTIGTKWKWRIVKDPDAYLPEYLIEHKELEKDYVVILEQETAVPLFDSSGAFLKRWDALALILLLFTAVVTPYETAFLNTASGVPDVDILFLINQIVNIVFLVDMFIQIRTPYRDEETGQIVRDGFEIANRYLKSWFLIDLISTIPWELLGFMHTGGDISQLKILRLIRLLRLLKLLRVLRASRKLRQWQVYISLRYATLQTIQYAIIIIFLIHWFACLYRIAAEQQDPSEPIGWTLRYTAFRGYDVGDLEMYMVALYWSSATISLVGAGWGVICPENIREFGLGLCANFVAYMNAVYFIAVLSDVLSISSRSQRVHDLKVDNYLEMFDKLKLDIKLKIKVHDYLSEHYALAAQSEYSNMLKELPTSLHGFITMEIFIDFLSQIPFLEIFIDREPQMLQELCRNVDIKSFPANSHLFSDGYDGVYFIERGVCAIEGVVYSTGQVMGRSVLREQNKSTECRALTPITVHILSRTHLLEVLTKHPKIRYYAKRWTAWAVLRKYLKAYAKLYYVASRRGAMVVPPLTSKRPYLKDGEFDDIDYAVIEHLSEVGF